MKVASYLGYKVPSWPRRELQITTESPNEHVGSPAPEEGSCTGSTCVSHKDALHGRIGLIARLQFRLQAPGILQRLKVTVEVFSLHLASQRVHNACRSLEVTGGVSYVLLEN